MLPEYCASRGLALHLQLSTCDISPGTPLATRLWYQLRDPSNCSPVYPDLPWTSVRDAVAEANLISCLSTAMFNKVEVVFQLLFKEMLLLLDPVCIVANLTLHVFSNVQVKATLCLIIQLFLLSVTKKVG